MQTITKCDELHTSSTTKNVVPLKFGGPAPNFTGSRQAPQNSPCAAHRYLLLFTRRRGANTAHTQNNGTFAYGGQHTVDHRCVWRTDQAVPWPGPSHPRRRAVKVKVPGKEHFTLHSTGTHTGWAARAEWPTRASSAASERAKRRAARVACRSPSRRSARARATCSRTSTRASLCARLEAACRIEPGQWPRLALKRQGGTCRPTSPDPAAAATSPAPDPTAAAPAPAPAPAPA